MSQLKLLIFLPDPLGSSKSVLNDSIVEASFPLHTCTTSIYIYISIFMSFANPENILLPVKYLAMDNPR